MFARTDVITGELFHPGGEDRLEVRAYFFTGDDGHLKVVEAGGFEPLMQLHLAEAKPVVGIKFARLLETMAEQIEHDDVAASF